MRNIRFTSRTHGIFVRKMRGKKKTPAVIWIGKQRYHNDEARYLSDGSKLRHYRNTGDVFLEPIENVISHETLHIALNNLGAIGSKKFSSELDLHGGGRTMETGLYVNIMNHPMLREGTKNIA